jgi:hypothetical protein
LANDRSIADAKDGCRYSSPIFQRHLIRGGKANREIKQDTYPDYANDDQKNDVPILLEK